MLEAAAVTADIVVAGIVGAAGLEPTVAALQPGRRVAVANKECLVSAGGLFMRRAAETGATVLPVDSEHNAVFQALSAGPREAVGRIALTASGGPFRTAPRERLMRVTPEEALRHPTWSMGTKITIDSATLMNKGLEVIEAHWLFDASPDQIDVVIHPQSIVHSMVELNDGSVIAQLGVTDMRLPIQYACSYPERWDAPLPSLDLARAGRLDFCEPAHDRFPCLGLAYRALREGGTAPVVLNAANEVAVDAFLDGKLGFAAIPSVIERTMNAHAAERVYGLDDVRRIDAWARQEAARITREFAPDRDGDSNSGVESRPRT
jgi:1-deoxy-D-xylulose-5-phosphate reductoisomerase